MERETAASSVSNAWVNIRIILTHTPPPKSSYLHACVFVWIKPNLYIAKKNILRMSKRLAQLWILLTSIKTVYGSFVINV